MNLITIDIKSWVEELDKKSNYEYNYVKKFGRKEEIPFTHERPLVKHIAEKIVHAWGNW